VETEPESNPTATPAELVEKYALADAPTLEAAKPPVRVAGRILTLRLHGKAGFAHISEHGHHSDNRSYEPKQRRYPHDNLQDHQPALEPGNFMPGACLYGIDRLGFGPVQMIGHQQQQPAHGRVMLLANPSQHRNILGRLARFHCRFNFRGHHPAPSQSKATLNYESQADHRG